MFVLKPFIDLFIAETRTSPKRKPPSLGDFIEKSQEYASPSVWILNPYLLSRASTGENRILDLTLEENLNYYKCFFGDGWPFEKALPIYSPWREERISSQHGMFTVHGTDLRPLNEQVDQNTLREIRISQSSCGGGAVSCRVMAD